MPRMDISNYRTAWETHENGESGSVTYVHTRIIAWDRDTITLNSGGWHTVTTKRKMEQTARQFYLPFSVFQHKGDWFVRLRNGTTLPFFDGITFPRIQPRAIAA